MTTPLCSRCRCALSIADFEHAFNAKPGNQQRTVLKLDKQSLEKFLQNLVSKPDRVSFHSFLGCYYRGATLTLLGGFLAAVSSSPEPLPEAATAR